MKSFVEQVLGSRASCFVACLLSTNVLAASGSETNAPDASPVVLTIDHLTNGAVLPKLSQVSGRVSSSVGSVKAVLVQLYDWENDDWWNWEDASWTGDLAGKTLVLAPKEDSTWTVALPRLNDGRYGLVVDALLVDNVRAKTLRRLVRIDSTPPSINFLPLHDQQTILDFSDVGGEIDKSAAIQLSICRVSEVTEMNSYWNGANWQTNSTDARIKLPVSTTGDFWFPSVEASLPKEKQIAPGMYLVSVFAFDRAGNEGRAAITVIKAVPGDSPNFTLKSDR